MLKSCKGTDKCIVYNCKNTKDQGGFIGDICKPCYEFLINPRSTDNQVYRNAIDYFKNFFIKGQNKMKAIEDYINEKFEPILNKNNVVKMFLSKNKNIIDSLYSQIFKNIECGNLQFTIVMNATIDMNIVNIIISKMNNNGWVCKYNRGDYKTEPSIEFTFSELNIENAKMVHDYYNK
ncbi:MAG: hypothetical protein KC589_02695 [Nanoarchaeota archaeon]|nr:hypothetical protein [Nanoarchaeota archaeon]